ncbi:MAG: hypothetical protein SFV17_03110 [Candidatus Obscuribacter sp.]|nr:hypothetical protein [Candidatus Obscuribacter sp.]
MYKADTIEVVFQHGWGQTPAPFKLWQTIMLEEIKRHRLNVSLECRFLDRGYFNKDTSPVAQSSKSGEKSKVVIVTHSLGLHLLDSTHLLRADLLLCLAGFVNWHRHSPAGESLSKRLVERMLNKLKTKPEQVLNDFYERCGQTGENRPPAKEFDSCRLYEDLLLLHNAELAEAGSLLKSGNRALVLQGQNDAFLSVRQMEELAEHLGAVLCELVPDSTHDLPNQIAVRGTALILDFLNQAVPSPGFLARTGKE